MYIFSAIIESLNERNALQIVPEGGGDEEDGGRPVLVPQLWSNYTGPEEPPAEEGWMDDILYYVISCDNVITLYNVILRYTLLSLRYINTKDFDNRNT